MNRKVISKFVFLQHVCLLLTLNLSFAVSQSGCPFPGSLVSITAVDINPSIIPIFNGELKTQDRIVDVVIGDEELMGRLMFPPEFGPLDDGTGFWVIIRPYQPDFGDIVDYHEFTEAISQSPSDGLLITMDTGDLFQCPIRLQINDTNNRSPVFNVSTQLTFTIPTGWDPLAPLNWEPGKRFLVTDWDATEPVGMHIIVEGTDNSVYGVATKRASTTASPHVYDVRLFVGKRLPGGVYNYRIRPNDMINEGGPVNVTLHVVGSDNFRPRFTCEDYFVHIDNMPTAGSILHVNVTAYDPDDELTGSEGDFGYELEFEEVGAYLEFLQDGRLSFTRSVPELAGRDNLVRVRAWQRSTWLEISANVQIFFPTSPHPEFEKNFYVVTLDHYPVANEEIEIPGAVPMDGVTIAYAFGDNPPVPSIQVDGSRNWLRFTEDMDEVDLGELGSHGVVVFDLVAWDPADLSTGKGFGVATYLVVFEVNK